MKTNGESIVVGVWGRTHKLGRGALPTSITTAGREILAGPVRLAGTVSGKPIEWTRGGLFAFRADQSH
ncbi:MAG: hypothetical protein N3B01_11940, partial [Verrucomicrobiae bacterium]|nr:hypothetical protein [Verrucomicrobiae bacterium]